MIGVDIIEIERLRQAVQDPAFVERIFTEKEREYCEKSADNAPRYAGRFAAKEAIAKALGTGFGKELAFLDIEILPNSKGAPQVSLKNQSLKIELSISHCKSYAVAFAIASKPK